MDMVRFITCGSVDDGKSTLLGRLLYDTDSIFEDQLETLRSDSKRYGTQKEKIDYALLTDGLLSEREQGITIDVAYRYFNTDKRKFIIADTPGHEQYTRNMSTAASISDIAVLLIDASKGISIQTKRHLFITTLFGIKTIIATINKMDLVGYKQDIYNSIIDEFKIFLDSQYIDSDIAVYFVPICAITGENLTFPSANTSWYDSKTLLEILETVSFEQDINEIKTLLPVQYVNRPDHTFRGYCGTLEGSLKEDQKIKILPSLQTSFIDKIIYDTKYVSSAKTKEAITITLKDELDISRGDIVVDEDEDIPLSDQFEATIVWMDIKEYIQNRDYEIKIYTKNIGVQIDLDHVIDINSLKKSDKRSIELNDIANIKVFLSSKIAVSTFESSKALGSFIIIDKYTNTTTATGIVTKVLDPRKNIFLQHHSIKKEHREKQLLQKPFILWFTGLSCSGKSTLANELEKTLFAKGYKTYLLDGDNLRHTLNSDLGFSKQDREENIRRTAHLSQLFIDAGLIVVTAFISPYKKDREYARSLVAKDEFIEIFLDTPIDICEQRDQKGLYKKAKEGIIKDFTGVNAPYEKPENAEIIINKLTLKESIDKIIEYLKINKLIY